MKKTKRIIAILGVVILASLYLSTLVSAIFSSPTSSGFFMASVYATIVVPVLMYGFLLIYKLLQGRNPYFKELQEKEKENKNEKDSDTK